MITYVQGSLFSSPADVLVNTVNLVGVMGKGIAKEFKRIYPEMFREYRIVCERGELQIGTMHYWHGRNKSILNFPTKRHWRSRSQVEDIRKGLTTFAQTYDQLAVKSIAFPQLGCGNGELDWNSEVRPVMEEILGTLPIEVFIHLYDGGDGFIEHNEPEKMKAWLRTDPRELPFSELWADLLARIAVRAIENSEQIWTVGVTNPEEESVVRFSNRRLNLVAQVDIEEIRNIWQQLRSYGFVGDSELPLIASEPLIELLCELDYIRRAQFWRMKDKSRSYVPTQTSGEPEFGLQLILAASPSNEAMAEQKRATLV